MPDSRRFTVQGLGFVRVQQGGVVAVCLGGAYVELNGDQQRELLHGLAVAGEVARQEQAEAQSELEALRR